MSPVWGTLSVTTDRVPERAHLVLTASHLAAMFPFG
jgi:hypothetical protein